MSILVSHAETTTSDNLLDNNTFDENTNGWTLSDSNVKRDANSYSDAGNSPTVRFKGKTSTISQLVSMTGIEEDKQIKSYTVSYNGYGCGNTPNGWCTAGADDTITTNITFTDGTNTEISSHVIAVPYEDGWTHHTFTKSINDTFLTGDVTINFELSGVDTGDSTSWLGPITDNYEFAITYEPYVVPVVVEPIAVIEPEIIKQEEIIKPIEVIKPEENMVGGIDLSTEITLDLIQDVQIIAEIPIIELTPEIGDMDMGVDMNMDIPTDIKTDVPVAIANINIPISVPTVEIQVIEVPSQIEVTQEIQEIQELPEINIEEPIKLEPEMVEIETPEELKEPDMQEDMEIAKNEEPEELSEQEAEPESKTNDDSELSESNGGESESEVKKEEKSDKEKKVVEKKQTTPDKNKSTKTTKSEVVAEVQKPTTNADNLGQISVINLLTLTSIPETITIQETVLLTQEMIYEQDIDAFTSSATYDSLISSSSSRWVRMVDVRPKHTFGGYGR